LPLQKKREVEGWGPWSTKEGVIYAHAPTQALQQVIALRLHLDASNSDNGPLKIVPGTHTQGVLTDEQIHGLSEKIPAVGCCVGAGGVLAMRPLVIHASSKFVSSEPRRVLHIEYASSLLSEDGMELAIA
jgi:ectoine hydroxylase-related dioxygenase (phytanoyl-CoA dioxygenase family)